MVPRVGFLKDFQHGGITALMFADNAIGQGKVGRGQFLLGITVELRAKLISKVSFVQGGLK